MEKEVMTIKEVAEYLQVSEAQVYTYMNQNVNPLPSVLLSKGTRRIKKQEVINWMARQALGGQE